MGASRSVSACSVLRSTTSAATESNAAAGPEMLMVALPRAAICRVGAITLAGRPVDGVGAHRVADGAALRFHALEAEAGLVGRPLDDEGHATVSHPRVESKALRRT